MASAGHWMHIDGKVWVPDPESTQLRIRQIFKYHDDEWTADPYHKHFKINNITMNSNLPHAVYENVILQIKEYWLLLQKS